MSVNYSDKEKFSQEADPMDCSTPGSSVLHSPGVCSNSCLLIQWCYLTITSSATPFSFCLQSFPASGSSAMSQLFCIRWPKYWSFSFSISPFSEYSGLISFRIDWFDFLAVQGTLKSHLLHQFEIINSSALSLCGPALTSSHSHVGVIKLSEGAGEYNELNELFPIHAVDAI